METWPLDIAFPLAPARTRAARTGHISSPPAGYLPIAPHAAKTIPSSPLPPGDIIYFKVSARSPSHGGSLGCEGGREREGWCRVAAWVLRRCCWGGAWGRPGSGVRSVSCAPRPLSLSRGQRRRRDLIRTRLAPPQVQRHERQKVSRQSCNITNEPGRRGGEAGAGAGGTRAWCVGPRCGAGVPGGHDT